MFGHNIVHCIFGIRYLPGKISRNLEDSFLDGIDGNLSKFVDLKHFGLDVLHEESSAPFFFTVCILKSAFCKDNSVEYGFDRCVEFYVEAQQKMIETRIGNIGHMLSKFTAAGESFAMEFVVMKHFA